MTETHRTPGPAQALPILESKLRVPRQAARLVGRPRLEDVLEMGGESPVTLVSAPAGYGKTTLIAAWLRHRTSSRPCAWVSLDERDRDVSSFWTYLLVAVDRVAPGTATQALGELGSRQVPLEATLAGFLNELSVLHDDLTLVLDDYHLCDGPAIEPGMSFLLDHLPPQVHVIISTRADPALPLGRLRARGQLTELRAGDLRFTGDETTTYLNDSNALDLRPSDVAALGGRTEGWPAALQLAAISLRGHVDRARFIADFTGDDRFVLDYLADEVLIRLPPQRREFLLDTSILQRLTGPLCDAVTGAPGGRAKLEALERDNLFVIPLDDNRRWYRYHHLFADVLNSHLLDERPEDVSGLHSRASAWFAEQEDYESAVHHALAAGDVDRAAELIEVAVPKVRRRRGEAIITGWAAALPADAVKKRPVLAIGVIGALMASNQHAGVAERLDDLQHLLATGGDTLVVADRAELARLPAMIETYRAAHALISGDLPGTMAHARRALETAAPDDLLSVASASALTGLASWARGDLAAAHRGYSIAADHLGRAGHVADVLACSITLADIETTQGRLRAARATVEAALRLAAQSQGAGPIRGSADMHVALSVLALEQGEIGEAAEHLRRAEEGGEASALPQNPYRWRVAMARLREAEGDPSTALMLLDEAEQVYVGDFSPNVRPIAATRARVLAACGRAGEALAWASDHDLSATDELSYLREYEHITLARVLLAAHPAVPGALGAVVALLQRLIGEAGTGGRNGSLVEVLVLHALTCHAAGRREPALQSLERAARLAEPEGYFRVFTTEGAALLPVLAGLRARYPDWSYLGRLHGAMSEPGRRPGTATTRTRGSAEDPGGLAPDEPEPRQVPVEPLSSRELDVLRYLGSELDGPSIARELSVSLSTVRTHTQHIYTKLGVNNRRAAIRRAHQLGLFSGVPGR